jgi:hypothetical protein
MVLAVHTLLLFLPPIPPNIKGPLVSYLAAYAAVFLLLVEFARHRETVAARWTATAPQRRQAVALGLTIGVLALGLTLRAYAPARFQVFLLAEYGLAEPATLFAYLGSTIILFGASRRLEGRERKHWQFITAMYLLLGLEEIDYFGIIGAFIGRIKGVYAGSLHDLIRLTTEGVLGPVGLAAVLAIFLVVAAALWRLGYLQPRALVSMLVSRSFVWVVVALGFYLIAAADETDLFGWRANPPYEELLELSAAICLAVYALELVAGRDRKLLDRELPSSGEPPSM